MKNNLRKLRIDNSSVKSFEEWKVASPWLRLLAQIVDQGIVSFAVISAMSIWFPQKIGTPRWFVTLILLWIFISTVTQTVFIWFYKNTPGKRSLGLTLQPAQPGSHHIRFTQIVVRSFTWWLGALTLGAGWSTILSRPDRRAWHDVAADTIVVANVNAPQYPTVFQKRAGELWLGFLSLIFAFLVISLLMVQMQTLHHESGSPADYRYFDQLSLLDQQSWFLVGGSILLPLDGIFIGDESKLSRLLILFSKGRLLPLNDRYSFYKTNMEPVEDELCGQGREQFSNCQSARLMVELLTPQPEGALYPKALQGLITLQNIETLPTMTEQINFISNEIRRVPVYSPQYLAFKSAEAKIYLKAGDFKRAKNSIVTDIGKISEKHFNLDKSSTSAFIDSSCQVIAIQDCDLSSTPICLESRSWKDWSSGCQLKSKKDFASRDEALGFWWSQARSPRIKDFKYADWETDKKQFESQSKIAQGSFDSNVTLALDFVINIKTEPKNILAHERRLAPENQLWGWAQKEALQELGVQWSYIIYPIERKILEKFNILGQKQNRVPASETSTIDRKPHLTPQLTIAR